MNREQRRSMERKARAKGYSAKEAKNYVSIAENLEEIKKAGSGKSSPPNDIATGDKIKLNLERIKARQNYNRMVDGYKQFVEESADKVFTAHVERPNVITMEEDRRWLFWSGDLDIVEKKKPEPKEQESEEPEADETEAQS